MAKLSACLHAMFELKVQAQIDIRPQFGFNGQNKLYPSGGQSIELDIIFDAAGKSRVKMGQRKRLLLT